MKAPLAGLLAVVFPCVAIFGGEAQPPRQQPAAVSNNPVTAALQAQLEKPIFVDMPGIPLARAFEVLAQRAGVHLIIQENDRPQWQQDVHFTAESVRPIDVLEQLGQIYGIVYEITPRGVLLFRAADPSRHKNVLRMYNVNDLTAAINDFGGGDELDDVFRVNNEGITPTLTTIADMIRNLVRPDSWDAALGTSIEERGGLLVVMQTEDIHAQIRRLLASFRNKQTRQVSVGVRVISVRSVDVDRLRAEAGARGVAAPVLDDAALAALDGLVRDGGATQLFAGNSTVFNAQRGVLENGKATSVVSDVEVIGEAYDPVIRNLNSGTVVCARPMLSDDGRYITLGLNATHSEVSGVEDVAFQRGGVIRNSSNNASTISIKRSEKKMNDGDDETKPPEKLDVTNEFDISKREPGSAVGIAGPMQLQMASRSYSRLSQCLQLRPGQSAAISAPMHGASGVEPGREMLVVVRCTPLGEPELNAAETPEKAVAILDSVKQALEKPVTLNFLETPLRKAMEAWSKAAHVPVLLKLYGEDQVKPVTLAAENIAAADALELVLRQVDAGMRPCNSLLLIGRREEMNARSLSFRVIDVRDLTTAFSDRPGETLGLPYLGTNVVENAFGAGAGGESAVPQAADFATLIRERLFALEFADPSTAIEETGGKLAVRQTPEVLERINAALHDLRHSSRASIVMTTRWAIVNTEELNAAFGKNGTALLNPDEAAKAFALIGKAGSRDLQASRILAFNGQRLSAFGGVTRGFISDYDINGELPTPVVRQFSSGAVVDLTPRIQEGLDLETPGQLLIETRLSLARTDAKPKTWDMLAAPNGKAVAALPAAFGKFEQPAINVERILTTVRIPDGGAALFRLPVPEWIEGEEPDALRTGKRSMIVLLHAVQQKL